MDWNRYRDIVEYKLTCDIPLKTTNDLENSIKTLTKIILDAVKESTPRATTKADAPFIPKKILNKIQEKRKLRKKWQSPRLKQDKTMLNKVTKNLKQLLSVEQNNSIQSFLENLSASEASDYSLWKATKNINRPIQHIPTLKKPDGKWARCDSEKAYSFAEHLTKVFEPNPAEITEQEEKELLNE